MSEIVTVRDGDIIAAEINVIRENAEKVVIRSAIEIGRRLVEAKSVVGHGEWMKWLANKVNYSQSTANNMMKLYQEYGSGETNIFDNWTNSEAFGKLSYTQHLALLALPFEERAEFAESHQVAEMSTRDLEKEIREVQDAAKADHVKMAEKLAAAQERAKKAEDEIQGREKAANAAIKEAAKARQDANRAETSEKNALKLVEDTKKALAAAEEAKEKIQKELDRAKENPEIPEAIMEELRKQAEATAAEEAVNELKKKLAAAEAKAVAAINDKAEAEVKAADMERQAKMGDPDVAKFQAMAEQIQQFYNTMNGYRLKVAAKDPEAGRRLGLFQRALLEQWGAAIEGA